MASNSTSVSVTYPAPRLPGAVALEAPLVRIRIGDEEHALTWEEWEQRVRDGRIPPDALICFEAVTGSDWVPARDLEMYRSLQDEARIAWQGSFLAGAPPLLTAALVGVQIRIWWTSWIPGVADRYLDNFTNFAPPTYENGESWRLLTMGLLHTETFHLALNMMWLAYTGWNLERALGKRNLATLYFASVLGGSLLSMLGSPETRSLGASGGVFGLVAASVVFGFSRPELLPERGRQLFGAAMLPYLLVMFWSGLMNEGTDNWSHFGGLVVGGALAFVLDPVPLQRRPGWNRAWQLGTAAAGGILLLGLALAGPRIHPIPDHQIVRARATRAELPATPSYEPLRWGAPAGWRPGMTPSGEAGFKSPAGQRSYAAVHREETRPIDDQALYEDWAQRLQRGWPDAQISPPSPATLAGREGLQATATITGEADVARVVSWRGTTRGVYTLQEIWEVESHRAGWLQPLKDRLKDRVTWEDPPLLIERHRDWVHLPESRRTRLRYASALLRAGEVDAAAEMYQELIEQSPETQAWSGLLHLLQWHPDREEAEALWDRALREIPSTRIWVEVAEGLEAAGRAQDALGVLDLAWGTSPGDRALRQARRQRGLPLALTADALPWLAVFDPIQGERRSEAEIDARLAPTPSLQAAVERGRLLAQVDQALGEAALSAWRDGDPRLLELLLVLRDGALPEDPQAQAASIRDALLRAIEGAPPRWLAEPFVQALRDQPDRLVALFGAPPSIEAP